MLFLSVRGFSDYAGPTVHSRLAWLPCCLPPTRNEVGILIYGLFAAQSPRPPMPLSTLQETPRDVPSKTRGQDGFATSFPVGLLHPLQHAGLSRRTPACPSLRHYAQAWVQVNPYDVIMSSCQRRMTLFSMHASKQSSLARLSMET